MCRLLAAKADDDSFFDSAGKNQRDDPHAKPGSHDPVPDDPHAKAGSHDPVPDDPHVKPGSHDPHAKPGSRD